MVLQYEKWYKINYYPVTNTKSCGNDGMVNKQGQIQQIHEGQGFRIR